jgi:hypothetical protein
MTDEKKIRELMERMAAMSPEPPAYSEEIQMTQPSPTQRRSPALILAVAAAAVIALVLPLILFQGGGEEPAVTTVPAPLTTAPDASPTTAPAPPTTTATTQPVVTEFEGVIYLVQEPRDSFTGNPALVPFNVHLIDDQGVLRGIEDPALVVTRLADLGVTLPEGFTTAIPSGVDGVNGGVDDSSPAVITMYMNQAFLEGAGGLLADITMLNQIIYTVTQDDPEALVQFIVDDAPVEAYGSEGLSLVEPVGRDSFLDEVNPIILTEPVVLDAEGVLTTAGRSNVFEATVVYRVTGTEVEGFTTATCGTGCWGDFDIEVDLGGDAIPDIFPPISLEVYTDSAEDGSPTYVISVPLAYAVGGPLGLTTP